VPLTLPLKPGQLGTAKGKEELGNVTALVK
jgi:hypothetical protein